MLTAERLREVLRYDPDTGLFRWRFSQGKASCGDVAGIQKRGYIHIGIDGKTYIASRLAHLYITGEWPPSQMDHKDGNKSNNRWSNLRPANAYQNQANRVGGFGASGIKNVRRVECLNGSWTWKVTCRGFRPSKNFRCLGQAIKYRNEMLKRTYGEFARVA